MAAHPKRKYTLEEYFDLERSTNERFEYWNGEVFSMSGGSDQHDQIETNSVILIGNKLRGRQCRVFSANMRIKVPSLPPYRYGDASVLCELIEVYRDVTFPAAPSPNITEPADSIL